MKNTDFTEQWTAMQKMTSAISAPLRENARRFWKTRTSFGQHANSFEWLVRRGCTGTHVAREAADVCVKPRHSSIRSRRIRVGPAEHLSGSWRTDLPPATDDGGNRRARVAAISAFGKPKEIEPARSEAKAPAGSKTA